ncbi:hypothetical protein RRG08_030237 [Elysia crispata]|uniref:Uncharacterized protein n=1 Tax=Elysia crispata TaxID=231223 RepID=A0AAE1DZA5_9GAST|nr:hypothetical protein RRG08_030237 [Elysia crispata]
MNWRVLTFDREQKTRKVASGRIQACNGQSLQILQGFGDSCSRNAEHTALYAALAAKRPREQTIMDFLMQTGQKASHPRRMRVVDRSEVKRKGETGEVKRKRGMGFIRVFPGERRKNEKER